MLFKLSLPYFKSLLLSLILLILLSLFYYRINLLVTLLIELF
jgi:hypothetical protein